MAIAEVPDSGCAPAALPHGIAVSGKGRLKEEGEGQVSFLYVGLIPGSVWYEFVKFFCNEKDPFLFRVKFIAPVIFVVFQVI